VAAEADCTASVGSAVVRTAPDTRLAETRAMAQAGCTASVPCLGSRAIDKGNYFQPVLEALKNHYAGVCKNHLKAAGNVQEYVPILRAASWR